RIEIDDDASGFGWFVDTTPNDDTEFVPTDVPGEFRAPEGSPAYGRIDLLTVLSHELGHVVGLGDLDPASHPYEIMTGSLPAGVRRLPVRPRAGATVTSESNGDQTSTSRGSSPFRDEVSSVAPTTLANRAEVSVDQTMAVATPQSPSEHAAATDTTTTIVA